MHNDINAEICRAAYMQNTNYVSHKTLKLLSLS